MKSYCFETFKVDPGNRAAIEACREVAGLQYNGPQPIILLGTEGAGKSHLLWAIVNAVRASEVRTGLALVTPRDFPDKVRALAQNPAPIQQGTPAILLVDNLDRFQDDLEDLEKIVRLFVQEGHRVVLASSIHPARIANISESFLALLEAGRIIGFTPQGAADIFEDTGEVEQLRAELASVRAERDTLRNQQEEEARAADQETIRQLRAELAAEQQKRTEIETKLTQLELERHEETAGQAEEAQLLEQLDAAIWERDHFKEQLDQHDREHQEKLVEAKTRAATLENEFESLKNEADGALAEQARLQGLLSKADGLEEQLKAVEQERDEALAQCRNLEASAEKVLSQFESYRNEANTIQQELQSKVHSVSAILESVRQNTDPKIMEALEAQAEDARSVLEAYKAQMEQERNQAREAQQALKEENEAITRELEDLKAKQEGIDTATATLRKKLRNTEFELVTARKQLSLQTAEMDALRQEAASQVASANIQAGELESRLTRMHAAMDLARETGRTTGMEAKQLIEVLEHSTDALRNMAGQLSRMNQIAIDVPPPEEPPEADDQQAALFDDALFEVVPEEADTPSETQFTPDEINEVTAKLKAMMDDSVDIDAEEVTRD